MSSVLYGALTRRREDSPANETTKDEPPGVSTSLDALAALVPAEVLALHAVVISFATTTKGGVTTITAPGQLACWF